MTSETTDPCWNFSGRQCPEGAACHYPLHCTLASPPEIILPPGWLKRDIERAQARLRQWEAARAINHGQ